jgi:hypothetical protein
VPIDAISSSAAPSSTRWADEDDWTSERLEEYLRLNPWLLTDAPSAGADEGEPRERARVCDQ